MIIVAKEFPSTRRLPQIASEAAGALCVPPAMMNSHRVALECPGLLETYKVSIFIYVDLYVAYCKNKTADVLQCHWFTHEMTTNKIWVLLLIGQNKFLAIQKHSTQICVVSREYCA